AATLAHGEQRALEVGLALATRPKLVLLDEPLAGMGPEEAQRMIALIDRVRSRVTVLLVEHDMDAVFRLANRISVLVNGRLIASGAPETIKADEQGRKAYLCVEVAARTWLRSPATAPPGPIPGPQAECSSFSRGSPSAWTTWATSFRAASSRCSPSAARW